MSVETLTSGPYCSLRMLGRFRSAVAVVVVLVAGGCGTDEPELARAAGRTSVQIAGVSQGDDARSLDLHVLGTPADVANDDACFELYEAEIEESSSAIEVQVFRVVEADYTQGGCENVDRVVPVQLRVEPGDREVIDRHDGRRFNATPDGYTTPTVCGLEDLACQGRVPPSTAVPAACSTESYRYAVGAEIDGGSYDISNERCDGTWAAFDVDFGSDACPPEAEPGDPCRGERVHRTFWKNEGGRWRILTYQGSGDCAEARAADPGFPTEICQP